MNITDLDNLELLLNDEQVNDAVEKAIDPLVDEIISDDVNYKEEAMKKLSAYEECIKKEKQLNADLDELEAKVAGLIEQVTIDNKELFDAIDAIKEELSSISEKEGALKEDLLPLQRELFKKDEEDKTLVFNKVQSTYVASTEKNQFDLKAFREEEPEFWEKNLDVMSPYAKITTVADYLKITIKK